MKIIEVPSFESPRISGQAKLNSYRDGWLILKIIVAERFPQFKWNEDFNSLLQSYFNPTTKRYSRTVGQY